MWELIPRGAIYCINLKRRKDRKRLVQREFERIGLGCGTSGNSNHPVTFFEAIESGPVKGCFESHQAVIRLARARQQKLAVIFEDDVYFSDQISTETWARYEEALRVYMLPEKTPWEILFLGHMPLWGVSAIQGNTTIYQTRSALAHAYIIRTDSKMADKLIQHIYKDELHVDIFYLHSAQALAVYPMIAFQTPGVSDNKSSFDGAIKREFFNLVFMNEELWAKIVDFLWWLVRRVCRGGFRDWNATVTATIPQRHRKPQKTQHGRPFRP